MGYQKLTGLVFCGLALFWVSAGCATGSQNKKLTATERAMLLVSMASGALHEGDPTGALQQLKLAEEEDPKLAELHHVKALAFNAKHDLTSAILAARKAVEFKPDYPEALNTLGKLLMDAGKYEEAEKYLHLAANNSLYRDAYKAKTIIGIMYYRRGQLSKAESYFGDAILSSPNNACIAYYYRGHIYLKASRLKDAIADYDHATRKLCARFPDAHLALGIAYEQSKSYQQARKKFLEIQDQFPNTKVADQAMNHLRYLP